jgi:DNA-binding CsgD family transcriptional regulator
MIFQGDIFLIQPGRVKPGNQSTNSFNLQQPPYPASDVYAVLDALDGTIYRQHGLDIFFDRTDLDWTASVFWDFCHKEDRDLVLQLVSLFTGFCENSLLTTCQKPALQMTFRSLHEIDPLKILCQLSLLEERDRKVKRLGVRLIDISFLNFGQPVAWALNGTEEEITSFKSEMASRHSQDLTPRELEIIRHIGLGLSNNQIAERLFISVHTVATHRKKIMRKTNCHSAEQLTIFSRERGLI